MSQSVFQFQTWDLHKSRISVVFEQLETSLIFPSGPENHREYIKSKVVSVEVAPFKPKSNVTIHTTDSEARAAEQGSVGKSDQEVCSIYW